MTRVALVALFVTGCAPPMNDASDAGDDAGGVFVDGGHDAGEIDAGLQCTVDGRTCWAAQTYCESPACSAHYPGAPLATCGDMSILPSCYCAHALDGDGGLFVECVMGCIPKLDGGAFPVCVTPNCGSAYCLGTQCTAQNHCE